MRYWLTLFAFFWLQIGWTSSDFTKKSFLNSENKKLFAKNASTFDPFIDYGEFQDDVTEEESINFFHYGRSISLAFTGGYEAPTFNIRQIYGDAPFVGANASFFLDLRFAIQISGVFPAGHYNSLFNSSFPFAHYGLDLKYYWNRQYLSKDKDFFSPYVLFGPFQLNVRSSLPPSPQGLSPRSPTQDVQTPEQATQETNETPQNTTLSRQERQAIASYNSAGIKIGFGFELALIKNSFFGFEVSYLYTVLQFENEDLSILNLPPLPQSNNNQSLLQRLQFPNRPEVRGYRFYGDLLNIGFLFGINF